MSWNAKFESFIDQLQSFSKLASRINQKYKIIHTADKSIIYYYEKIKTFGLARSETSTRCRPGNGLLGLANIWSRLMKHNWWDPLYGRVRTHSDVFSDLIFNENSPLYGYISWSTVRRSNFSPCMRMVSNHDLYFIVVDRPLSFWTAEDRSYRKPPIDFEGIRELSGV